MSGSAADSLAQFHRDFRPALMAFFLRRSQSHAEAEDLTQEVFIRIAGKSDAEMRSMDAYVFQVAANLLRDRARREKVRNDHASSLKLVDDVGIEPLDPHRVATARQQLQLLSEALTELPERTRQIFLLFRFENVAHKSIADSFGITVSAVEKHLARAMAHLIHRVGVDR